MTVRTLAQAIRSKQLSTQEVVAAHLARIEQVNPQLNAITQLAPDALRQARQADRGDHPRRSRTLMGPLDQRVSGDAELDAIIGQP